MAKGLRCTSGSTALTRNTTRAARVQIGKHKGALLIRNYWDTNWRDKGYGWLVRRYRNRPGCRLLDAVRAEYVDTELFG